jgi:hypothetical protein
MVGQKYSKGTFVAVLNNRYMSLRKKSSQTVTRGVEREKWFYVAFEPFSERQ